MYKRFILSFMLLTNALSFTSEKTLQSLAQDLATSKKEESKVTEKENQTTEIFIAKEIITMDPNMPKAGAIAVKNGKIVDVGSLKEVEEYLKGEKYKINKTFEKDIIFPGFIDQHLHPLLSSLALTVDIISIEDWKLPNKEFKASLTPEDYLKNLKDLETSMKDPNEILFTWGYHQYFHGKINKEELDKINKERPIIIWHRSCHEFTMNSAALKKFNIDQEFINKQTKSAQEQSDLKNGHFWEQGIFPILPLIGPSLATEERLKEGLNLTKNYLAKNGITTSAEPGGVVSKPVQELENKIIGGKDAPFRFYYIPDGKTMIQLYVDNGQMIEKTEEFNSWGTETSYFLPKQVKLFADGAVFSQLMQMKDGYTDGHKGEWMIDPKLFSKGFKQYWDAGYQIHIHQNGDLGLEMIINELEKNMKANPRYDHRTTVVHFAFSNPEQVKKLKKLGAIVSSNPYYTVALGEKYSEIGVGKERAQYIVRNKEVLDNGLKLSFHSDMPMAPSDPLFLVWCAVNRKGAYGEIVGPSEIIEVPDAFKAITIDAAHSLRLEDKIGSLEVGKDANFTILNENPYTIPKDKIKDIKVVETVLEGKVNNINESDGNNRVSLYLNTEKSYNFTEEEIKNTYGCSHGNSLGNYVARVWGYNNK